MEIDPENDINHVLQEDQNLDPPIRKEAESVGVEEGNRQEFQGQKLCIHRVPPHLHTVREGKKIQRVYDPIVLSLGPYHYGKPQFHQTERFKEEVLNDFISIDGTKKKDFFYEQIFTNINQIRDNYEEVECNDQDLAEIILRDACFVATYVRNAINLFRSAYDCLGMSIGIFMGDDLLKLENQIPFWVVKHVLDMRFGRHDGNMLVYKHLSFCCFYEENFLRELPWEVNNEPLHLLEAYRRTFLKGEAQKEILKPKVEGVPESLMDSLHFPSRSVTYLLGKGIRFRPSTFSLRDVRFTSYPCYGVLQLPTLYIDSNSKVLFSNMVTYEMFPRVDQNDFDMISYVNFMKSLIETPKDVKELQEKGILKCSLGNDEEIVKAFKEIDTYGNNDFYIFADVKVEIAKHCRDRTKTWMSEFIHCYLDRPWCVVFRPSGLTAVKRNPLKARTLCSKLCSRFGTLGT